MIGTLPAHVDVAIIGAGQAGLSVSRLLAESGVDHVLLERETIAHEWHDGRWDAFTLVTPNWQCRLPGYVYDGDDPDGFMRRDEVLGWVRGFARSFDAPVLEGVEVTRLEQRDGGGFRLETTAGELVAGQVVIATGGYHVPIVPTWAARLPDAVTQLHSSEYRSAAGLPAGGVLVVGSGQSGTQIAEDLALEGRDVTLALGSAPRVARFYRGRDCVAWLSDMGVYDRPVEAQAGGLAKRESTNHYVTGRDGGRDIDLRAFARGGMHLVGRLLDVRDGVIGVAPSVERSLDAADAVAESIKDDIDRYVEREGIDAPDEERRAPVWRPESEPVSIDLEAAGITTVVWAIGYRADYRWVRVGVFDGQGAPTHHRGVTGVDGLYFVGLPWLHTWGSGRFASVARDAEHLAGRILDQRARTLEAAVA